MAWYNTQGKDLDTVISSRIRFARNLSNYRFSSTISDEDAKKVINEVSEAIADKGFLEINFDSLSAVEKKSYVEKHYVSPEFASKTGAHTLLLNESTSAAIMLCEEDHIRLQCIQPGFSLEGAYKTACAYDDAIDERLDIAYDEKLGYLTSCPTNLGTGMRASVMMFLPMLTMTGKISSLAAQLSKIGLTMRGLYGEGSQSKASIYQISNQVTLGITEEDTIKKLSEIVTSVSEQERALRGAVDGDVKNRLYDKILRSEGIMKHAYMLSSSEFAELFASVRLGVSLDIIKEVDYTKLDELFVLLQPATLMQSLKNQPKSESERDIARAEKIKSILNSK